MLQPKDMIVSSDRRWIWNGVQWVPLWVNPAGSRRQPPRWLTITAPLWLIALSAWEFVAIGLLIGSPPAPRGPVSPGVRTDLQVIAGLGCLAVLATIGWGALVGHRREFYWLWIAAAAGTAVLLFGYVVAMLASPSTSGADNDNAAGAGVVILAIPTAAAVITLLWLGAGIGALSRRLQRSSRRD